MSDPNLRCCDSYFCGVMHDCVSIPGMSGSLLKRHMDFSDYIQICIKGFGRETFLPRKCGAIECLNGSSCKETQLGEAACLDKSLILGENTLSYIG